jgi:hypothetical protein
VTDGKILKVIDCTGATPTNWSFGTNPASNSSAVDQVAIDGTAMRAVAIVGDDLYVYDLTDPNGAPMMYTIGAGFGLAEKQVKLYGDYMLCAIDQSTGPEHAALVNLTDGTVSTLTPADSAAELGLGGTKYVYFVDETADDSLGSAQRAGTGTVSSASAMLATLEDYIDGSTTNNGAVGFAQTCWVTPDGSYCFLAGSEGLGSGEYLQYSTGGNWMVPADAVAEYGVPATDVHCSADCVAFKSADATTAGTSTVLAYIVLP